MFAPGTTPEMLRRSAETRPETAALIFGDEVRTFAELEARSDRLAGALAARGVGRGDRVALLMHNGTDIVEAFFGIQKAGAAAVPINFRLVADEVAYILADSGAKVALASGELTGFEGFEPFAEVSAAAPGPAAPAVDLEGEDLAFLMYTSGTTGRPKGAMLTHDNLVAATRAWIRAIGARSDDVWMSGQPLFHIGGLNGLLPFIALGTTAVLNPTSSFDPEAAVERLLSQAVTCCVFVPTQWQEICASERAAELAAGPLKTAIWGASAAPRATLELMVSTLPGVEIVNAYGQTEMSGTTTMMKGDPLAHFGSVGRPLGPVEARIVDEDGAPVRRGEVGELVYRGPMVMKGYLGRPRATAEAFEGGWFHSGDLLREDEDGYLYVVDRKKDMIVSGGENVYPAEVERALGAHPAVADVAVVGVEHPRWVETPVAVVVLAAGTAATEAELLGHCRDRLAGYKKPARIFFVDGLPRNAAGKVLKLPLRERYADSCRS
ncbi:MAG TPA: AMP-binding protein [Solirubrobacterales bacterium]|nr:AMP-binding protein [Solirubrobacterales bacterium]